MTVEPKVLRIGHSPDPDDAFMWYPLADIDGQGPKVDCGPYQFEHVLEDIESLNHRSEKGELEITAFSIHQYAYVADKYVMTSCGSSMGDGYGPMFIARKGSGYQVEDLPNIKVAVPGIRTTAFLSASILYQSVGAKFENYEVVMFDEILDKVESGEFDAGLIIHEGQLTYGDQGLEKVIDLGEWWMETRGLPLPLGGNAIRRDLMSESKEICTILQASIEYALEHREEAVDYAMNYARNMGTELADDFVGMYVNDWTLDYGKVGVKALNALLSAGAEAGVIPAVGEIDLIYPEK